jgi:hypothetical protein
MFRFKAMAAAVLLAASGLANAQMQLPGTGNGSLTFVAYDPVTLTTYSFNTGTLFQSFLPAAASAPGTTFSFALPSWSSFLGTAGLLASNVLWAVYAGDLATPTGVMTTGVSAGSVGGASRVANINGAINTFANAHNLIGTHPGSTNGFAISQSTAASAGTDGTYGGNLFGPGNNFNNNASFSVLGSIGQSLGFYLFTGNNVGVTGCTSLNCTRYTYGNSFGAASWTLNGDGTLVYTAPVPEASTYAMMLAGLLTLGFVARRRMNGK